MPQKIDLQIAGFVVKSVRKIESNCTSSNLNLSRIECQ
ncbi:hypothetical protein SynBIOSE41_02842 [Synechococcus sp. BIOS-E4-1]|nr:hypothetical protein SynBIOSE41_02842 [Synechococcus sp. BIOS-E4-1]